MGQIASKGQLRMEMVRWALLTVPLIVLLGLLSGRLANAGYGNLWFDALRKPSFMPPGWVFPLVWTTLYLLMGVAFAIILAARGAPGRQLAIRVFVVQLALNLLWSPLFFGAHKVSAALGVILLLIVAAAATAWLFYRIRPVAGALLIPYLIWLALAASLNYQIGRLNPDAERVAPSKVRTQIGV